MKTGGCVLILAMVVLLAYGTEGTGAQQSASPLVPNKEVTDRCDKAAFWAQVSGGDLYRYLKDQDRLFVGFANGHIMGVIEADSYYSSLWKECSRRDFAPPAGSSIEELVGVVEKYLGTHPESWNLPAVIVIRNALTEAFPCKK
jgi:Rap1a immunity proteins